MKQDTVGVADANIDNNHHARSGVMLCYVVSLRRRRFVTVGSVRMG